jgi:hypothetical protein
MLKSISIILKRGGLAVGAVIMLGYSLQSFAAVTPGFDSNIGVLDHSVTFTDRAMNDLFTVTAWGDIDQQKDDVSAYDQTGVEAIENPLNKGCNKNSDGSGGYGDGGKCGGRVILSNEDSGKNDAKNQGDGMGVNEGGGGGSSGISGRGQQRDEQVVFDFEAGVFVTSFTLTGWHIAEDRAVLYIEGRSGGSVRNFVSIL